MRLQPRLILILAASSALLVDGCSQAPEQANATEIVDNAIDADLNATAGYDDRADHLDQQASTLSAEANSTTGNAEAALRSQAAADLDAAARIRQEGQDAGRRAEDAVENSAGVQNNASN